MPCEPVESAALAAGQQNLVLRYQGNKMLNKKAKLSVFDVIDVTTSRKSNFVGFVVKKRFVKEVG